MNKARMEILPSAPVLVFNNAWSTAEEQQALHNLLPVSHSFGDKHSVLSDGSVLAGPRAHDEFCDRSLRIRCRKRCTLAHLTASACGGYGPVPVRQLPEPESVLTCFTAVPDWQGEGLDVEHFFFRPCADSVQVGSVLFSPSAYMTSTTEDLVMSIMSIKHRALGSNQRVHLKLAPLAVGPTIRNRFGDAMGDFIMPLYVRSLQFAVQLLVDHSWVHTLEFIDFTRGQLTPSVRLKHVRILSGSRRDAFDFEGRDKTVCPALIVPADAFAVLGQSAGDRSLAATLAANSDLRKFMSLQWSCLAWGGFSVDTAPTVHAKRPTNEPARGAYRQAAGSAPQR